MNKQNKRNKLTALALIMCLMLLFTTACGKGNSAAGGGANQGENPEATATTETAKDTPKVSSKNPINIYTIGTDTVVVVVKSDECKKLAAKGEHEESDNRMSLHDEEWAFQIGLSTFYANLSYKESDDNWVNIDSGYEKSILSDDYYLVSFRAENLVDRVPTSGEFTLTAYTVNDGKETEVARADIAKSVQAIDNMQFANLVGEVLKPGKPEGAWDGMFMTDSYSDVSCKAEIKVLDSNAIYIKTDFRGKEEEFVAVEEELEGNDETYFHSNAKLINGPTGSSTWFNIQYSKNDYGDGDVWESISFGYDDYDKNISMHADLKKFKPWHVADADYKDEDTVGKISKKDPQDDTYFKPETDDYIIQANYYEQFTSDGLPGEYYTLYSFDSLGRTVQNVSKSVLASEADAKKLYEDRTKYGNESPNYIQAGNVVYCVHNAKDEVVYSHSKWEAVNQFSTWTLGNHYAYGYKREDGSYYSQCYISKPFTEADYNLTTDDVLFYNSVQNKNYRNKDFPEATLYLSVNDTYFSIDAYGDVDAKGRSFYYPGNIKVNGKKVVGVCPAEIYNYDTYDYTKYIMFTEYNFDEHESTIKQYYFKTDDFFTNDYTFDNYTSKTPDEMLSGRYDMDNPY